MVPTMKKNLEHYVEKYSGKHDTTKLASPIGCLKRLVAPLWPNLTAGVNAACLNVCVIKEHLALHRVLSMYVSFTPLPLKSSLFLSMEGSSSPASTFIGKVFNF